MFSNKLKFFISSPDSVWPLQFGLWNTNLCHAMLCGRSKALSSFLKREKQDMWALPSLSPSLHPCISLGSHTTVPLWHEPQRPTWPLCTHQRAGIQRSISDHPNFLFMYLWDELDLVCLCWLVLTSSSPVVLHLYAISNLFMWLHR